MFLRLWCIMFWLGVVTSTCLGASAAHEGVVPPKRFYTSPTIQPTTPLPATPEKTQGDNYGFALELLHKVIESENIRNHLISPFMVELSLGIIYEGASGATQETIARALGRTAAEMTQMLEENAKIMGDIKGLDKLHVAHQLSSVWVKDSLAITATFKEKVNERYKTRMENVKMKDAATLALINDWHTKTSGAKIPQLITELSPATDIFLINSMYWQPAWDGAFKSTGNLAFKLYDGKERIHEMMYREGNFEYMEDAYCQAIRMPIYKAGMEMELFLPKELPGIADIGERTTPTNWQKWQQSFAPRKGTVIMPQYKTSSKSEMKDLLSGIGFSKIFKEASTDYVNIFDNKKSRLSRFLIASILVVETTGSPAPTTALKVDPAKKAFHMLVDHPFFFVIRHKSTGRILFIGTVTSPKKSGPEPTK
jgi:serine protease inhibitor